MTETTAQRGDGGFTLIELVIAIAVIGILSAVAIIGLSGLQAKSKTASCNATADSSATAAAVYSANHDVYPTGFDQMINDGLLALPSGVTSSGGQLHGKGWNLTFNPAVSPKPPTFTGCP